ncbi:MAG: TlpA family protein disulfide reductase [Planctomycetes bacterium]|nr:TlpA family protein disulfide reductase [Planctomycetota bacterium]
MPPARLALLAPIALVAIADPSFARADIADRLDEVAPEIECAKWVAGQPVQLSKLRGRVVVLHFSDPERITSQAAVPPLKKLAQTWKDAPVTIVEVVTSPAEASALSYAAKESPAWAAGLDASGVTQSRYPGTSMPRTYLIGPDGRIVWHAHVLALTKELVQAQLDRVQFFAPGQDVKKAKGVAKAASEMKYAAALAEAGKVEADKLATDADRALIAAVRADIERTWELKKKLADALIKDLDWGIGWRRALQLQALFKGTAHQADADAFVAKLDAEPMVKYVRPAQNRYDDLLVLASKARTKSQIEEVIKELKDFQDLYKNLKLTERAADLVETLEKRLADLKGK